MSSTNALAAQGGSAVYLLVGSTCPGNDGRRVGGIHDGGFTDQARGNAGDLRHPVQRVFSGPFFEFIKPHTPAGYELLIVQLFFNDNVDPAQGHGRVRACP